MLKDSLIPFLPYLPNHEEDEGAQTSQTHAVLASVFHQSLTVCVLSLNALSQASGKPPSMLHIIHVVV